MTSQLFLIVLDCIAVSFGMFIVHMFLKVLLAEKKANVIRLALYPLFGAALVGLSLFFPNMFVLIMVTFVGVLSISILLFSGSWHSRVFATLMFCFLAATTEIVSSKIIATAATAQLADIHEYGELRIISNILANLLFLFVIKTVAVFLKNNAKHAVRKMWELTPLLVFLLFSILLLVLYFTDTLFHRDRAPIAYILEIVALVYMNVIVFWYYDRIMQVRELKHEKEVMEIQTSSHVKYYERFKRQQDEFASTLHDIDKHLKVMERLAESSSDGQASEYFDGYKKLLSNTAVTVHTSSPVISVILSDCVSRAQEIGVDPDIEVYLEESLNIDPVDITTILGNTIDNALRALSALPVDSERRLYILLRQQGEFLLYEIRNNFSFDKEASSRIGYGLRNVRACAEKYNGEVVCEDADGRMYSVSIILQGIK